MLDKWFEEDIKNLLDTSNKIVLIDVDKNYDFLVDRIFKDSDIEVFKVEDYLSDLKAKYRIEKEYRDEKVLIHSYLDPAVTDRHQYMIQEYAATGVKFSRPLHRYIAEKSGLKDAELNLEPEELIIAGKMSLKPENNREEFWQRIKTQGKEALLGEFTETALQFLVQPEEFTASLPDGGQKVLYNLLGRYLARKPDSDADPEIAAQDFAATIFTNILQNKKTTEEIYHKWLDSHRYREYLANYLKDFELPAEFDIWKVNPNHPFKEIDERWLKEISEIILSNQDCPAKMINAIKQRYLKREGMAIAGSEYWESVFEILNFQAKEAHEIDDLNDFIELYKRELYKLDQALRHLNQHLLDRDKPRRAFQALYEEKMKPYLRRWFELFDNYRENQTDYLADTAFADGENKAVIIGDAISYEVSQEIIRNIKNESYNITNKIMNGNLPSTTANNMSSLFGSPYSNQRAERERALKKKLKQDPQILDLDQVEAEKIDPSRPAIIYSRDIDVISEQGHEAALKYYATFIDFVVEKIKSLLEAGFSEVHLLTDHGFVCNFAIDEADKFAPPQPAKEVKDRYVLADERVDDENYIIRETCLEGYEYCYFPKGINPVKSRQQYGFAHGGITPQEILLPHIIFKKESSSELKVEIANKKQLKSIGSTNFNIKLKAEDKADLFRQERELILKIEEGEKIKFSQELIIKPGEEKEISLTLELSRYTILIQDKESKEVLDSVKGEKEKLRGGLDEFDLD